MEIKFTQQSLIDLVHLRVAREQDEGAPSRKLRRWRPGRPPWRQIAACADRAGRVARRTSLARVVVVRGNTTSRVLRPSLRFINRIRRSHQGRRREHSGLELIKQGRFQDGRTSIGVAYR